VDHNKEVPFFMFYAINMPHYPYQPTQKWREYYKNMEFPRAGYAAFISTIDERIGLLLEQLDKLGLRENTIIVYQSDNGYSTEVRAFNGGGNSGPYRGAKSSLFEGGIRLPTIVSWRGKLPENTVNNQMLLNTDWMPTLTSLCKLKTTRPSIDGIDLSDMLKDPSKVSARTGAFWKYGNQWVVRKGKWKLIGYPKDTSNKGELDLENDALFLSNLDKDVSEMYNLALEYPEVVQELTQMYSNWEYGSLEGIPKKAETLRHLGMQASIKNTLPLHPNYKNIEVLLDGKRGYADFSSGQWIGQEARDLEFVIDLKEAKSIHKIACGFLNDPGNYIFKPKSMEVSVSSDGSVYSPIANKKNKTYSYEKQTSIDALEWNGSFKSRFVKLKIKNIGKCPNDHKGAGNDAWIFIDEIIFE